MHLEDWRECARERVDPLYAHELARWREQLGWQADAIFEMVEEARTSGHLPGYVAIGADGAIIGWCYANVSEGWLFVGALHGRRAEVVRALLDAILASPEAACVKAYRCFVFPETPAVAAALARRRFDLEHFLYLARPLSAIAKASAPAALRAWTLDDLPETARLLARAYAGSVAARCFAPGGRLDEWAGYLAQVARTAACGVWAPGDSFACQADDPGSGLAAALVATRLSPVTTHVAQLVVDPRWRRRGLAATLLQQSAAAAEATGARRQTLLVGESNQPARALYAALGFTEVTRFLFADRPRISRTAKETPAAAGASRMLVP